QRHRRQERAPHQTRNLPRRHRHRHADGHHHRLGSLQAPRDGAGTSTAGRDAGRDAALHADQLRDPGLDGQSGGTRREQGAGRQQRADGPLSVRTPRCAPGGPNDYVSIMTSRANSEHWDRLLKLIEREDLIGDARYLTPADRVEREPEVDEVISAWTRKQTKLDAMKLVGEA